VRLASQPSPAPCGAPRPAPRRPRPRGTRRPAHECGPRPRVEWLKRSWAGSPQDAGCRRRGILQLLPQARRAPAPPGPERASRRYVLVAWPLARGGPTPSPRHTRLQSDPPRGARAPAVFDQFRQKADAHSSNSRPPVLPRAQRSRARAPQGSRRSSTKSRTCSRRTSWPSPPDAPAPRPPRGHSRRSEGPASGSVAERRARLGFVRVAAPAAARALRGRHFIARRPSRRGAAVLERFAKAFHKSATFERNVCARHTFW
jgi:hypothetical protein